MLIVNLCNLHISLLHIYYILFPDKIYSLWITITMVTHHVFQIPILQAAGEFLSKVKFLKIILKTQITIHFSPTTEHKTCSYQF